jgi:hypothetical protein
MPTPPFGRGAVSAVRSWLLLRCSELHICRLSTLFPRSRAACNTYHLCAVSSLASVSRVKGLGLSGIETKGDIRSTSRLEQEERGFKGAERSGGSAAMRSPRT